MATLIVVGKRSTREHPITDHVTVIGRDEGVNLDLGDLQVSRRHALVVRAAQGFFVKDLGSRNGMTLNQSRIPPRQQAQLKNGDVLAMGRTTLIFKDLNGTSSVAATLERPAHPTLKQVTPASPQPATPAPPTPAAPPPEDEPLADSTEGEGELDLVELEAEARRTPISVEVSEQDRETPAQVDVPTPPAKRPSGKIPKARAPGPAPVYSGQAEVLTLRALMERAERDRVFYRNLALILFCLLIGTVVILIAWALANRGEQAPAETSQATPQTKTAAAAPAPRATDPAARLDPRVFASDVHPVLTSKCARCHDGSGNGGRLLLASSSDPATVRANRAAVRPFVVPGQPKQSALLLKPIATTEGGSGGHPVVLEVADAAWKTLQTWVATTVEGAPPRARVAAPTRARVGQAVAFDGSGSVDPDGTALRYRWSLVESPARAQAALTGLTTKAARLVPDLPGRYIVALVVKDGAGSSGSTTHSVQVVPGAKGAAPTPKAKPKGRDLSGPFQTLLGRAPTAAEQAQVEKLHGRELHAFFLAQPGLYERWWASELTYLGLIGEHAPTGDPWDSLPRKLRAGQYAVSDVHYALMVGSSWRAAYPGREPYVDNLLKKLLGSGQVQTNLRTSALRLYDGYEASLLGETVKGQIGLVRAVVRSPQALRHLLRRSYTALTKRQPTRELIEASLKRMQTQPTSYFRMLVEWASPPA